MLPPRLVIICLFCCHIKMGTTRFRSKELYGLFPRQQLCVTIRGSGALGGGTGLPGLTAFFGPHPSYPQWFGTGGGRMRPRTATLHQVTGLSGFYALFPAASRIRRGGASMVSPTFHSSFKDVHLLFEILLAGIHFDAHGEFSVNDGELASLRKTQKLGVICEEIIPKELSNILRLISDLSAQPGHLHQDDFERTLLTLVYITERMVNAADKHQRDMWAESFVSLYRAIKQDLTI